ncbi:uncharacterized protein LOC110709990 [Chenopodium quinoa]|uniref:uncharacterized protein LOC110709990 n=1 Tax=Chenopodium quinoa TaxID=63459 RepID=UPI000B772D4B|nr:uncharacterized protein LOC110709990 [Chenopodium quinoa]
MRMVVIFSRRIIVLRGCVLNTKVLLDFAKSVCFVGHGRETCPNSDDYVKFHFATRFRKLHETGARVLFEPIDSSLYTGAISGVSRISELVSHPELLIQRPTPPMPNSLPKSLPNIIR